MTDPPDDEDATGADEEPADRPDVALDDLRYVGPATAEALEAASITAADLLDHEVTFLDLIEGGVDPGVAARLRREYSLPWADGPTTGARLRRRAAHIRHLRDDERSWIDASWSGREDAGEEGAATDGSGSATDAEEAWRERGREQGPPASASGGSSAPADDADPPIDPGSHTVPELEEAVEAIDDPAALAAVLRAERAGDDRVTAVEAIEDRLRALGVDPNALPRQTGGSGAEALDRVRSVVDDIVDRVRGVEVPSSSGDAPVAEDLAATASRVATAASETVDAWAQAGLAHARRYDARLRALEDAEWRRLSVALLVGLVSFSAMAALLIALQPAEGPPGLAAMLVLTVAVGAMGMPLRWWGATGGHGSALLAGVLALGAAGLFSTPGAAVPQGLSALLPLYVLVAVALVAATALSWGDWYS